MKLQQLGNAAAFRCAQDHALVKLNSPLGLTVKIPDSRDYQDIAFCVVHAIDKHERAAVKRNPSGTIPVFRIQDPKGMKVIFIQTERYGRVIARKGILPATTNEFSFTAVFHTLSSDKLNEGTIHSYRPWNFIVYLKGRFESKWKLLESLPVQVCKEVTGASRDPRLLKRNKRPTPNQAVTTGSRHGFASRMRYTPNIDIAFLRGVVAPQLIQGLETLAQCTCQPKIHNIEELVSYLKTLLEMVGSRAVEVKDSESFSSGKQHPSGNASTIVLKVELEDIVDKMYSK